MTQGEEGRNRRGESDGPRWQGQHNEVRQRRKEPAGEKGTDGDGEAANARSSEAIFSLRKEERHRSLVTVQRPYPEPSSGGRRRHASNMNGTTGTPARSARRCLHNRSDGCEKGDVAEVRVILVLDLMTVKKRVMWPRRVAPML
jgi:hypothetical protein